MESLKQLCLTAAAFDITIKQARQQIPIDLYEELVDVYRAKVNRPLPFHDELIKKMVYVYHACNNDVHISDLQKTGNYHQEVNKGTHWFYKHDVIGKITIMSFIHRI